ncbi:MAG: heme-degrading domain-containing protein [Spirochaetales bacterium]
MDNTFASLLAQEAELQFTRFDNAMAWKLGSWLADKARKEGLKITIGITRAGQRLFHYAAEGTTKDNDEWVNRKVRTVYRFGHSSFFMGCKLTYEKKTPAEKYYVDEREYAFHGGCFPIFLKGTGLIGTLTISGLPQEQDHALCVEALRHVLKKDVKPKT